LQLVSKNESKELLFQAPLKIQNEQVHYRKIQIIIIYTSINTINIYFEPQVVAVVFAVMVSSAFAGKAEAKQTRDDLQAESSFGLGYGLGGFGGGGIGIGGWGWPSYGNLDYFLT